MSKAGGVCGQLKSLTSASPIFGQLKRASWFQQIRISLTTGIYLCYIWKLVAQSRRPTGRRKDSKLSQNRFGPHHRSISQMGGTYPVLGLLYHSTEYFVFAISKAASKFL